MRSAFRAVLIRLAYMFYNASGWQWARVAVWDVAGNGAFVNPFWRP